MEQPGQVGGHNLGRIFIRSYPVIYANKNVGFKFSDWVTNEL